MRRVRERQELKTVVVYERDFSHGMAATTLIYANEARIRGAREWLHYSRGFSSAVAKKVLSSREIPKVPWWGVMEAGDTRGFYRLKDVGWDFAFDPSCRIPKYVYEENSVVLGFSDGSRCPDGLLVDGHNRFPLALTNIHEALGSFFNHDELLRNLQEG